MMFRLKNPSHPGAFIKDEVITPLGLTVTTAAKVLGVTRAALSAVLNGRAALSPQMALRVEKAFGPTMDTLLRMQTSHDIAQARRTESSIKIKKFARKAA
jgi:addiction module HigA family antidote